MSAILKATAAHAREVRLARLREQRAHSASQATAPTEVIEFKPQPGKQEKALACPADILIYGGTAGSGKTWVLLLEGSRHYANKEYGGVIFRRIYPNITNEGGMWDESKKIYPYLGATADNASLKWVFPSGARLKFSHLQYLADVYSWKGAQVPFIGFDQLEEFEEEQFWYMLSRNRSLCGVRPYIRATVNPVPKDDETGGWVHKLIQWWIDEQTGYAIPERDGIVRWFIRIHDEVQWYDSREEAVGAAVRQGFSAENAQKLPKSLTFIGGRLKDNQKLMEADPGYYANLMALPLVERLRLYGDDELGGNWNAKPEAGKVFNRAWFDIAQTAPSDTMWVRYWDKAGTSRDENPLACYSVGVKMGYSPSQKRYFVGDVQRGQWAEYERESRIRQTAQTDGPLVTVYVEQEPGSGGKESAKHTILNLAGFACFADRVKGDKYVRAKPYAAIVQSLQVSLVNGPWVESYLSELHNYTPNGSGYKDQVDASSGAFNKLTAGRPLEDVSPVITPEMEQRQRDEQAEAFRQQVRHQGCVFPGEW